MPNCMPRHLIITYRTKPFSALIANPNAVAIARPKVLTIISNSRVPLVELLETDAICLCEVHAALALADVSRLFVQQWKCLLIHTGLWHRKLIAVARDTALSWCRRGYSAT